MNESTQHQMDGIVRKQQLVNQVDKKINDLSAMVISLDVKMETQMQRKALIEKMEKTTRQLIYLYS